MKKTNNEFMLNILDEEAWKDLSYDFEWTENLLEKYQDKVDWVKVSSNEKINWTISMVQKFSDQLHWAEFSECVDDFATEENLELFKEKWDWHVLSDNRRIEMTFEILKKFAEYWDWGVIIDRYEYNYPSLFEGKAMRFFEKFQEYIPASKLQDSTLWHEMVNEHKKHLISKINEEVN